MFENQSRVNKERALKKEQNDVTFCEMASFHSLHASERGELRERWELLLSVLDRKNQSDQKP